MKTHYIAYPSPPPFFKIFPPPPFPVMSNPHPHCSFCCLVSLAEWVIALHLMCYFTERYHRCTHVKPYDLDACFMQQGLKFTEVWHRCGFSLVLWFDLLLTHKHRHTHKDTQHTQGSVDGHTHINIYLHQLLCAHSNYLYYIE